MWLGFSGRMQEENIPELVCFNFYFGTGRRIGTTDRSIYIYIAESGSIIIGLTE